jgi:hypothetical protein
MVNVGGAFAPAPPVSADETGISPGALVDLLLKTAYTVPTFTTEWMALQLHLTLPLVRDLLEELRQQLLLDVLGQSGALGYRYSLAQRGRERAARAMEISG